jgi:hypothetical protein
VTMVVTTLVTKKSIFVVEVGPSTVTVSPGGFTVVYVVVVKTLIDVAVKPSHDQYRKSRNGALASNGTHSNPLQHETDPSPIQLWVVRPDNY